jgi:hypothetical protein
MCPGQLRRTTLQIATLHQPGVTPKSANLISGSLRILQFFFFGGTGVLNSGLCLCKAGTLLLEPCLQPIFLCYCRDGGVSQTVCPGWPGTTTLPISASQVARITGLSNSARMNFANFKHILSFLPN